MEKVCRDCGTTAEPKRVTKGSIWVELVLWLCFIIPGLIYSVWRLSTRYDACPACQSPRIVPVDSPVGQKLAVERIEVPRKPSPRAVNIGRRLGRIFAKK